jgi:hypothetical protein
MEALAGLGVEAQLVDVQEQAGDVRRALDLQPLVGREKRQIRVRDPVRHPVRPGEPGQRGRLDPAAERDHPLLAQPVLESLGWIGEGHGKSLKSIAGSGGPLEGPHSRGPGSHTGPRVPAKLSSSVPFTPLHSSSAVL